LPPQREDYPDPPTLNGNYMEIISKPGFTVVTILRMKMEEGEEE